MMGLEWSPRDCSSTMVRSRVAARRWSTAEPSIIDGKHCCRVARYRGPLSSQPASRRVWADAGRADASAAGPSCCLGVLSSRLEALPPQLRLLLSEGFLEYRSAAGQLDVDPVAFYSADKTAIDAVSETASDVRHSLARVGRTDEANLSGEVCRRRHNCAAALEPRHDHRRRCRHRRFCRSRAGRQFGSEVR
jgi:hypothetical protein